MSILIKFKINLVTGIIIKFFKRIIIKYNIEFMFKIIIYILIVVQIVDLVPLEVNYDLYLNKVTMLGIALKLIKLTSSNAIIVCNYSLICGLKLNILLIFLGFSTALVLFIVDNIIFVSLNVLTLIFIKALTLNFYQKHFKFKTYSIKEYIKIIINNAKKIIIFLIKLLMVSLVLRIIVRSSVYLLLNGNDSIASNIIVIILSITIYYYLLNILIKYIKTEKINYKDFYLYNKFVIERVNLYNLTYLISINIIIKQFHGVYFVSIIGFILFLLFIYFIFKYSNAGCVKPNTEKVIKLQSTTEPFVFPFIALSVFMQVSCNSGYTECVVENRPTGLDKFPIGPANQAIFKLKDTTNIVSTHNDNVLYSYDRRLTPEKLEIRNKIEKSPILRMAYNQQMSEGIMNSKLG